MIPNCKKDLGDVATKEYVLNQVSKKLDISTTNGSQYTIINPYQTTITQYQSGIVAIKIGNATVNLKTMIGIKGYIQAYKASTSFEAFVYLYPENKDTSNKILYGANASISNGLVLNKISWSLDKSNQLWLLLESNDPKNWYNKYVNIFIEELHLGYQNANSEAYLKGWNKEVLVDTSKFSVVEECKLSMDCSASVDGRIGYMRLENGFIIEWGQAQCQTNGMINVTPSKIKSKIFCCLANSNYRGETSTIRSNSLGVIITPTVSNLEDGPSIALYFRRWTNGVLTIVTDPVWATWVAFGLE